MKVTKQIDHIMSITHRDSCVRHQQSLDINDVFIEKKIRIAKATVFSRTLQYCMFQKVRKMLLFEGRKQNFVLQTVKGRAKRRLRVVQLQKNISCVFFFQYTTTILSPLCSVCNIERCSESKVGAGSSLQQRPLHSRRTPTITSGGEYICVSQKKWFFFRFFDSVFSPLLTHMSQQRDVCCVYVSSIFFFFSRVVLV